MGRGFARIVVVAEERNGVWEEIQSWRRRRFHGWARAPWTWPWLGGRLEKKAKGGGGGGGDSGIKFQFKSELKTKKSKSSRFQSSHDVNVADFYFFFENSTLKILKT